MIVGRVDELRNSKVYGWAFNSDMPDEHLEIRINRGADVIATGLADILRKDLPDAGIGKGDHAFEIVVPPNISSFAGLVVLARSSSAGEAPLQIATNDDRRLDDLFQVVTQRYDDVLIAMKSEIDELKDTGERIERDYKSVIEDRLTKLERRIEDYEVFIVRLDEISRALQERAGMNRSRGFLSWFRKK